MQKIKNIEFLRILMIFGIIMHHAFLNINWSLCKMFPDIELYSILKKAFWFANNGVEGFFIIAGFFFAVTFKSNLSLFNFIKSKYIRLAPVIVAGTFVCGIASYFNLIDFKILPNILTVLLLNNSFIRWGNGAIGSVWYVSALFTCFVLFFILKKYIKNSTFYIKIIAFFSIFAYVILEILRGGNFGGPGKTFYIILNIGFLRAIGGIGLGIIIGEFYKKHKDKFANIELNKFQYLLVSFTEIFLISGLFWWTFIIHKRINNIFYVLGFVVLLQLFILCKGYFSKLLNKDIWVFLSKYTYSIFVTHTMIYKLFSCHFWVNYSELVHQFTLLPVFINLLLVILLGILAYHYIEKPCVKYFSSNKTKEKIYAKI